VNLIGYCEEDDPFNRMMVFEYAPNGTLFEHLHGNNIGLGLFMMLSRLSLSQLITFSAYQIRRQSILIGAHG